MQQTYPLVVSNAARISSQLGDMCRPLEGQLLDARTARAALDQEVRAHSPRGPLFVKSRQARWFPDAASRVRHREAAWDVARAALKTDIGRAFCAEAPRMVDDAWSASGMPRRGQPVTLRQVVRLARLIDYLFAFQEPRVCDGTQARYQEACQKLRVALACYPRSGNAELPADSDAASKRGEALSTLLTVAWRELQRHPDIGGKTAIDQALLQFSPTRQAPAVPGDPTEQDFRTPERSDHKYG